MGTMKQGNRIWNWIVAVLKGTLVGLAIVIPGVSGGSMLLTIGVYEDAVSITSKDKSVRNRAIIKLIPYAIGIVLGVAALSFVITWLLGRFELFTILLFCGLILGSLPMLIRHIRGQKVSVLGIVLLLLMIVLMVVLPLLGEQTTERFVRLNAADTLALNDRVVLSDRNAGDELTVTAESDVYKVKSAQSGLKGLIAKAEDGVLLESDRTDGVYFAQSVTVPTLGENGTITVDGTTYTVYRAVDMLGGGWLTALISLVLGFVAAGTMVVPGVSGSMVLLVLGYYYSIMGHLKSAIVDALSLNFAALLPHLWVLLPFVVGVVLGLVVVSKLIRWLLDRHPIPTYYAIIGLMVSSPFAIFAKSSLIRTQFWTGMHWYTVLIALVCLGAGFFVASFMAKKEQ